TLRPVSAGAIAAIAARLQKNPRLKIEVRGHTDSQGTEEYNQKLSEQRAEVVRDAILAHGIEPARLRARGFGMSQPVVTNENEEGRSKNRRTDFVILAR